MFLEEHRGKGVLVLLGELGFHARDGGFEEEGDEVFVCALCAAFVVFHPLLLPHPISYLLLILLTDKFVFLYFLFEHRRKDTLSF